MAVSPIGASVERLINMTSAKIINQFILGTDGFCTGFMSGNSYGAHFTAIHSCSSRVDTWGKMYTLLQVMLN
jgi:hypothetical protein